MASDLSAAWPMRGRFSTWPATWRTRSTAPLPPMTACLLGIAVGRAQPLRATAERLTALAGGWPVPAADPGLPVPQQPSPSQALQ
jgi:hypothetical protein